MSGDVRVDRCGEPIVMLPERETCTFAIRHAERLHGAGLGGFQRKL